VEDDQESEATLYQGQGPQLNSLPVQCSVASRAAVSLEGQTEKRHFNHYPKSASNRVVPRPSPPATLLSAVLANYQ